jgi:GT2 family glycosyltransferase
MDIGEKAVSVIILNYLNYMETIECVNSIVKQKYNNYDIVIVDNNSPNESYDALVRLYRKCGNISVIREDSNLGYARANNRAILWRQNNGPRDYYFILNNDIVLQDRNAIKKLVTFAERTEDCGIVSPRVRLPNGRNQGPYKRPNPYIIALQYLFPLIWIIRRRINENRINKMKCPTRVHRTIGACIMIKAGVFIAVNGFDTETFLYGEEDILAAKMAVEGYYYYYYPNINVLHNHEKSVTKQLNEEERLFKNSIKSLAYYFEKYQKRRQISVRVYKIAAIIYHKLYYALYERLIKLAKNMKNRR